MMTKQMAECTISMLDSWQNQIVQADGQDKVIEVNRHFQELTADVISHAAFGSSYAAGKEVFLAQQESLALVLTNRLIVPISIFK